MPYLWSKKSYCLARPANTCIWITFWGMRPHCVPAPKNVCKYLKKISIENSQIVYWNDVQFGNKTIQRWKFPNKFGWGIVLL